MKKKIALIMAILLTATIWVGFAPTPALASALPEPPTLIQSLMDQIEQLNIQLAQQRGTNEALRNQIADLEQRLEEALNPVVYAPNVRLVEPTGLVLLPGEVAYVELHLRNIGSHTAFNLLTQARASDGAPFTVSFADGTNSIAQIRENHSATMTMRVAVSDNAAAGNHSIALTHLFRNYVRANISTPESISVRIGGADAGEPNLRLGGFSAPGAPFGAGQNFTVSAQLANTGDAPAYDVRITLGGLSADGVFFVGDLNQAAFDVIEPGEVVSLSFAFSSASAMATGTTALSFNLTHRDAEDPVATPFFVNIQGAPRPFAAVQITGLSSPGHALDVGQNGTISFYIENSGTHTARDIVVTTNVEAGIVPTSASRINIREIAPGTRHYVAFDFMPTAAAVTRSYTIGFEVDFTLGDDDEHNLVQFAALTVHNPEREEDDEDEHGRFAVPRIIVHSYTIDPLIPRAGQEFEMEITFWNTSQTRSINNIRISLEPLEIIEGQGFVFIPVGGSNTLFLPFLSPGQMETKTVRFFTVADAAPRSYNMRVSFDYQDETYLPFDSFENLSITVSQFSRLEYDIISVPPFGSPGQGIFNRFSIINSGMVPLANVRVRVDGDFETSEANIFIGPIPAGRAVTYAGTFVPWMEGFHEGAIVIYGEDPTGAIVEVRHDFTIEVMGFDMGGFPEFPMDDPFAPRPPMGGDPWDPWAPEGEVDEDGGFLAFIQRPIFWGPAGGGLLLVVAIVVTVLIRRKRNRLDFADDDL